MTSNRRARQLARAKAAREAAKALEMRARRRRRWRIGGAVAGGLALVGLVVGLLVSFLPSSAAKPTAAVAAGYASCVYTKHGTPARPLPGLPPAKAPRQNYTATIALTEGTITVQLDGKAAPCTVNAIRYLAGNGFYTHTPCFRLTTSGIYVLQCGDPTGTGTGGPGFEYANENTASATYPPGTLAMANAGPGTNGSQFFLVYKQGGLAPSYTVFGHVTSGLSVLTGIAAHGSTKAAANGFTAPKEPVEIDSFRVSA